MARLGLVVPAALAVALALGACSSSSSPAGGGGGAAVTSPCTLPAAASLTVVRASPASGATGVSVNAPILVTFNTCLDLSTVGAITVTDLSRTIAVRASYDGATSTLTLQPVAPLAWSTFYEAVMSAGLRGAAGEKIQAAALAATIFTTRATPDTIPPVTTATPPAGSYNHAVDVTLSCADDPGGVGCAGTFYTLDGTAPSGASARYTAPLHVAAATTVRFASVDLDGNWEAPRSAAYVIDVIPPTVVAFSPPAGATGVALDAPIVVTFSEAMNAAALSSALSTAPLSGAWPQYDPATFQATFRPDRPLDCGTTYQVTLAGATDLAGNALAVPSTWSFTTSSDCAAPATAASPGGGTYVAAQSVTLSCTDGAGSGCARIVYTTDGSVPSPTHGTVSTGSSAGPIAIGAGETVLRFYAVDVAGNREPMREERYAISASGFTWVATSAGVARGAGPVPDRFYTRPSLGATYAFFRDPVSGRLWRGTEQSVAFSDDGVAWTACPEIHDGYNMTLAIAAVWARGSFVLAGTRDGLYGSLDGGMTWSVWLRQMVDYYTVAGVRSIDGRDKDLFVATTAGLAMSHDSGRSWTWRGFPGTAYRSVVFDPSSGQLYAASAAGLSVSADKGATFATFDTLSTPALPSADVRAVAVTADRIHLATAAGYVRMARGASGAPTSATTIAVPCAGGDTSVLAVAASPTKVFLVTGQPFVTGSTAAFCVSGDAGLSFAPGWFVSPDRTDAIAWGLHVEGSSVYVGYPPGWYLSTDGGLTFAQKELPIGIADVAASGGTVYAATSSGLAVSTDGFRSFVLRNTTSGLKDADVRHVAVSGSSVYAVSSWGLSISTDGGVHFNVPTFAFVNSPESVGVDGSTVFAGTGTILYRSTTGGASWAQVLPPTSTTYLSGTPAVAVSGSTVALGDSSTAWISANGGTTFVQRAVADGLTCGPSATVQVQDVAVSSPGTIWVASSCGAFVSTNGGASFGRPAATELSAGWVNGVEARAGAPTYFATDAGLAISTDGGATITWRKAAEGIGRAWASVYAP